MESLPNRALTVEEIEKIRNGKSVENVIIMFDTTVWGGNRVFSFVIETESKVKGLHCNHSTAEWEVIAEGNDINEVIIEHQEWLDEEIDSKYRQLTGE